MCSGVAEKWCDLFRAEALKFQSDDLVQIDIGRAVSLSPHSRSISPTFRVPF